MKPLRIALTLPALLATTACGLGVQAIADPAGPGPVATVELHLPDPGDSGPLALARKDGSLDKALAAVHARVAWGSSAPADFAVAAKQLAAGTVDIAAGDIADCLGPLADHPAFRLFGVAKPDLMGEGVLVKNYPNLRTVSDLVGRKVAVQHGGTAEYLLLKALEKNGVPSDRVQRVYLDDDQAARAFRSGDVDGWAVSGQPVLAALTYADAHFVASGHGMGSDNYRVWAVRTALAEDHPEVVKAFYRYLHGAMRSAQGDPAAYLNVFTDAGPQAVPADQRALAVDLGKGADPVGRITESDTVRLERVAQLLAEQKVTPGLVQVRPALMDVDSLPDRAK